MPASRNPFFVRTAEQTESDDQFLSLFSMAVLDFLPEDGSWNRLLPIETPPGSGKSTLLRLFTPTVLTSISNARHQQQLASLVKKLMKIDAIDEDGVQLLGILVNCKEDYSRLADFGLETRLNQALFWSLLHSRLALLTIRASLQLKGYTYPHDVKKIRFEPRSDGVIRRPDARVIDGEDLFERARKVEQRIVDSLNSFVPRAPLLASEENVDDFFQLLNTHRILIDGQMLTKHTLVMFDDAHLLYHTQRETLIRELERHDQSAFASWVAMRLRGLEPPAIVTEEVRRNREGFSAVTFDKRTQSHIQSWLLDVGDRRASRAQRDVSSFEACLSESLESEYDIARLTAISHSERDRAVQLARPHGELYDEWLSYWHTKVSDLSPVAQASRWAQLQIFLERRNRNGQGEFTFSPDSGEITLSPFSSAYLEQKSTEGLEIATIFMSDRNGLPVFYGAKRVAQLASSNVDQFLSLASILFDLLLNTGNLSRFHRNALPPSAQHRSIVEESRAYLTGLHTAIPYGVDVLNLITGIAKMCREESWRPNVPITPGVTGVSIQISERDQLIEDAKASGSVEKRLLNTLAAAIAHNVLSLRPTDRQRDENRVVFYLNRLICPAFGLPLGFGGYKPVKVSRLSNWITAGESSEQLGFDIE